MAHLGKRSRATDLDDGGLIGEEDVPRLRESPEAALMSAFSFMSPEEQNILRGAASLLNIPLVTLLRQREQPPATTCSSTSGPPNHLPLERAIPIPNDELAVERQEGGASQSDIAPPMPEFQPLAEFNQIYENAVPWVSTNASTYREEHRGFLDMRNRRLNGFVPVGKSGPPPLLEVNTARSSPVAGTMAARDSTPPLDPESAALSALVEVTGSNVASPSPGRDAAELSDDTTTIPRSATPSESSGSWTQHVSAAASPSYALPGLGDTDGSLVHVTFVPCNPSEPAALVRRKRGPFQTDQLREDTSKTRQLKACIRCRLQKMRCLIDEEDPSGTCLTCQNVNGVQKVHNLPCLRYRLTECTEFRVGKAPGMQYSARWPVMKLKDITKWASSEIRTITVKSDVSPVTFDLKVRKFVPIPQDCLHRAWMHGTTKKFIETTPFAISDMRSAMVNMRRYITDNIFTCIDYFLQNADELVKMTFKYAREYMQKRTDSEDEARLLANYMKLWVATRRTQTLEHIASQDTLDMDPETEDKSYPLPGKVPLPPVMIQQLDIILTVGLLLPLQKQVLDDMQKLVLSNNPRTWMTMYLTTFMSLQSCASLSAENYRNARRQGFRRRYSFPAFIQERHNSANIFLSHYHYRTAHCNPFKLDWKRRHATPYAHMATEDVIFIEKTKKLLAEKDRVDTIRAIREGELYENDLFFVSQMFEDNWQPRDTTIDYDGGMIHGGPVKKYYTEPVIE